MLTLESDAFGDGELIPLRHTCEGDEASPELLIDGTPAGTESLALIMEDPDVPKELSDKPFVHWVLYNIPPDTDRIPEGDSTGTPGLNGAGEPGYIGPCPPLQYEPAEHRYVFTLYALSSEVDLPRGATKEEVLAAIQPLILEETELVGRYRKQGVE